MNTTRFLAFGFVAATQLAISPTARASYEYLTNYSKNTPISAYCPSYPTGIFAAQNALATPFDIAANQDGFSVEQLVSGWMNPVNPNSVTVNINQQNITAIYTLISDHAPLTGDSSAIVTFSGSAGSESFDLVNGVNVRDWADGEWCDTVNGTTTQQAFITLPGTLGWANGGQLISNRTPWYGQYRLDEQVFDLTPSEVGHTLYSMTVSSVGDESSNDAPILFGVTAQAVPEPRTTPALVIGALGVCLRRRRAKR